MQSDLLTQEEVAKYFKCCVKTIQNWTKAKKLKAYGIGALVYYKKNEIENALTQIN